MLAESKLKTLLDLTRSFTKEELIWVNGYLSGLVANGHANGTINGNGHAATGIKKISLLYGTETGNSKKLAADFAVLAKKKGITAKLTGLDQYRLTDLEKEEYLFVVVSTHGEGEPPAMAKKFYDHIHQGHLNLKNLKYSVLALGDTAYPLFCKTGEDIDGQLERLGAQRIVPLQKCDLDFEADAEKWVEQSFAAVENQSLPGKTISLPPVMKSTGRKYYDGTVITNINLNDRGSNKETYHIEISTEETIDYEPGDSLAIVPLNKKSIVEDIIHISGIDPSLVIETGKITAPVEELLTRHLNICYLLTSTVKRYAVIAGKEIPDSRMDLIDLLRIYTLHNTGQFIEVIKILLPIAPRLYSISSSAAVQQQEIHITVSKHSFYTENEQRYGLCSEFIGELPVGANIVFYIHKNRAFKLPAEDKSIIMIGPGTGIAPCRSFLAHRDATGASGRNWLFFGEEHFTTDFLYQAEIQHYLQTGVLTKISLAFSRDQEQKVYVQHRLVEHKDELTEWINNGAHLYVSGSKLMSSDVEETLKEIIGEGELNILKDEGRYQKDVY